MSQDENEVGRGLLDRIAQNFEDDFEYNPANYHPDAVIAAIVAGDDWVNVGVFILCMSS